MLNIKNSMQKNKHNQYNSYLKNMNIKKENIINSLIINFMILQLLGEKQNKVNQDI